MNTTLIGLGYHLISAPKQRKKQTKKTNEENKRRKQAKKNGRNYIAIRKYLQQHGLSKTVDIAAAIELSPARTRVLLKEIPGVYFEGTNTNRRYYLLEE